MSSALTKQCQQVFDLFHQCVWQNEKYWIEADYTKGEWPQYYVILKATGEAVGTTNAHAWLATCLLLMRDYERMQ